MEPTERKGHSKLKAVLVLSILLNIGLFYWVFTLRGQVNGLVGENQRLAANLSGAKQESEILSNQLAYYKAQADYYSRLYQSGSSHPGIVGKSSVNMVAVQQIQRTIFTASYKGVVMNLVVELTKGEGRLLVNTQPKVGIDLQTSGRTAILVAQNITKIPMTATDVILTVIAESNVEVVDGPSAGAAMTVAMIAAIRNQTLRRDVFMSGTVNQDQTVGPVGGLEYKALAAAEKGATLFLVPKSQSTVTVYKPVEKQPIPGLTVIVYEATKVSLESILKEHGYRVTVAEVVTIQDAYLAFTKP